MEKLNEHTAVLQSWSNLMEQRRMGSVMLNDIQQNWKSFSELREETDLRLQAAYSQLQVRCTPCNAPVDKLLLSLRCIQCSVNK